MFSTIPRKSVPSFSVSTQWNDELQKEFFKAFMEKFKAGARIIAFQGMDIGFFNDCETDYIYEIGNICILPEYQNQGIA